MKRKDLVKSVSIYICFDKICKKHNKMVLLVWFIIKMLQVFFCKLIICIICKLNYEGNHMFEKIIFKNDF